MINTLYPQGSKIRVVIDTNLWISSLIGKRLTKLRQILEFPQLELVTTSLLTTEITTVALRAKFRSYFTIEDAMELLAWISTNAININIDRVPERCRDPKDDYLLELAVQSKAIYLVSGDNDLLELGTVGDCRIMTVAQFEEEFLQDSR